MMLYNEQKFRLVHPVGRVRYNRIEPCHPGLRGPFCWWDRRAAAAMKQEYWHVMEMRQTF